MNSTRVESAYISLVTRKSKGVKRQANKLSDCLPTPESSPFWIGSGTKRVSTRNESLQQTSGNADNIECADGELMEEEAGKHDNGKLVLSALLPLKLKSGVRI
jgi:hypothetical protein